jgi:hypothetical protein
VKPSALALAFALCFAANTAGAVERQHHLGAGGGISLLKIDDKSTIDFGGMADLHYAYGLSDAFNFVAEGGYAIVAAGEAKGPDIPTTRPASIAHVGAGATYVLDVISWVPYIGALGTGYVLGGGSMDKSKAGFGVALAVGLDYQISRSLAVGIAGRQHLILNELATYPSYTEGFLRAEFMWGW